MQIERLTEKIPGGMMLVPLSLDALCHIFSLGAGKYFGSFTNGMTTGTVSTLVVRFFYMGASIKLSVTKAILHESGTLVVAKIAVAWVVAAIVSRIIPEHGVEVGFFAGFLTLVLVAAMGITNGGPYASIMQQCGTKEEVGAFVLMSLESGPSMMMIILGAAGTALFEPHAFVDAVLPFLMGLTLGNLDPGLREFFSKAVQTLIPFSALALGNIIDSTVVARTDSLEVLSGVAVIIVAGIPLIIVDKLIGGSDGTAGIAASNSVGAAVAAFVPVTEMVPASRPIAPAATSLVAMTVIVTSILVSTLTSIWSHKVKIRAAKIGILGMMKQTSFLNPYGRMDQRSSSFQLRFCLDTYRENSTPDIR